MTSQTQTIELDRTEIAGSLVTLLAVGAGLGAAALYYSQPMLGVLGQELHATPNKIGWIPTLTQLGYAIGLIFLIPLGDRFDRRTIILCKAAVLCAALLLAATANSLDVMLFASLAIGLSATIAQDLVPAAAALAAEANRGRTVGRVMTGLLLGILLSRVVSGFVAEHAGWRSVFVGAAVSVALLGVAVWRGLPRFASTMQLRYVALLGSVFRLLRRYSELRRAALAQGLLSVAFSAFWSTLAVMLHAEPFHLGSASAGAFGLAGAAGALAAPLAGRMADREGPELVTRIGASLVVASFVAMALLSSTDVGALWVIGAGAVVFDLGVQASLIAHQTIVYGLEPAARSRLNAVLMGSMFIGMASGAWLGSQVLSAFGWQGVCSLAALAGTCALTVRFWPANKA
jgi:predicted MFS family arabinose efflux permease